MKVFAKGLGPKRKRPWCLYVRSRAGGLGSGGREPSRGRPPSTRAVNPGWTRTPRPAAPAPTKPPQRAGALRSGPASGSLPWGAGRCGWPRGPRRSPWGSRLGLTPQVLFIFTSSCSSVSSPCGSARLGRGSLSCSLPCSAAKFCYSHPPRSPAPEAPGPALPGGLGEGRGGRRRTPRAPSAAGRQPAAGARGCVPSVV